jgi:hypothetical protein
MAGRLHGLQQIMADSPAWQRLTRCGTSSVNDGAGDDDGVSSCRFVTLCCYCIVVAGVVFSDIAWRVLRYQSNRPLLIVEFCWLYCFLGFVTYNRCCCSSIVMPSLGSSF